MTQQAAGRSKVQHERTRSTDGAHSDDTWQCESDATHTFIKLYGPNRVRSGDTVLDDTQHVLITKGFCPLCSEN
jgi:hypothetical protein